MSWWTVGDDRVVVFDGMVLVVGMVGLTCWGVGLMLLVVA